MKLAVVLRVNVLETVGGSSWGRWLTQFVGWSKKAKGCQGRPYGPPEGSLDRSETRWSRKTKNGLGWLPIQPACEISKFEG